MRLAYPFFEPARFAFRSLTANKLRSLLSLLGMVIGIFLIISINTLVDGLQRGINQSLSSLGDDVIFVQKWPWSGGFDQPWWKYINRPQPSQKEARWLRERVGSFAHVSFRSYDDAQLSYLNRSMKNTTIVGMGEGIKEVLDIKLQQGRFFNDAELAQGSPGAVIGSEVARLLFPNNQALGQEFRMGSGKFTVIGVLQEKGQSLIDFGEDERVHIAYPNFKSMFNTRGSFRQREILVRPKQGVALAYLRSELNGAMRAIRKIHPLEEEDFALNESSLLQEQSASLTGILNLVGLFIGGIAILVGAFGVANILFVSVRERTPIIGLQKALGAKRSFILMQFMMEALSLSIVGGLLGLLLVALVAYAVRSLDVFDMQLSLSNIINGLWIAALVGLIAGIFPAWSASRLAPVEAIRRGQ
jgi:putative ABC transport system permease protein